MPDRGESYVTSPAFVDAEDISYQANLNAPETDGGTGAAEPPCGVQSMREVMAVGSSDGGTGAAAQALTLLEEIYEEDDNLDLDEIQDEVPHEYSFPQPVDERGYPVPTGDEGHHSLADPLPNPEDANEDVDEEEIYTNFTMDETVLIFDWDDTVFPSSWVQDQGLRLDGESPLSDDQHEDLGQLAHVASETLRLAKTLGTVILVTNAERGWIQLSCQKFMPALFPSLENIKLLSARSEYETPILSSPFEWKLRAFESEIRRLFVLDLDGQARKNVVSLGDSAHEREALLHATADLPNCRTKSLKFLERPEVQHLRRQHAMIARCLRKVVHHNGNLDLCLRSA